jgi:hypothetical protein
MTARSAKELEVFPNPLDLVLEQFHNGEHVRLGGLIHFGQDPVIAHLTTWFEDITKDRESRLETKKGNRFLDFAI